MMKGCTFGGTLEDILTRPKGLSVLRGADDDGGKPNESGGKDDEKVDVAALQRQIANFESERDRYKAKIKKAEDERDALKGEVDALKKDGATDETIKAEAETLRQTNETLKTRLAEQAKKMAFLTAQGFSWNDPDDAFTLLAKVGKDISVDDDGTVDGMDTAIKELVKQKPYLLKAAEPPKDDKKQTPPPRTGDVPGAPGQQSASVQQAQEQSLRSKYPALRR